MKLPWTKLKQRKLQLEEELEEVEKEKKKLQQRFEKEQNKRKKLARKKQEAEEERNRLSDKINSLKAEMEQEKTKSGEGYEFKDLNLDDLKKLLQKLSSIESRKEDLLTIYSPKNISDIRDTKGLKNSIPKSQYEKVEDESGFVAFLDDQLGGYVLKISPFFQDEFLISDSFDVSAINQFIEREKYWILASAGYTEIFGEENGDYEQLDVVKSRVNREHSKGGFSQGRFERKRKEQVEGHFKNVKEAVEELGLEEEKMYVLGDKKISKKLSGTYLGGFDPNRSVPERFYKLQLKRF